MLGTYCSFGNPATPPLPARPVPAGQAVRRAAAATWRLLKPFAFGIFDVCSPAVPVPVPVPVPLLCVALAYVLLFAFLLLLLAAVCCGLSLLQHRRLVIYAEGFDLA